jgi:acetyltransferase-like isoleucine patch superfamily enzyme
MELVTLAGVQGLVDRVGERLWRFEAMRAGVELGAGVRLIGRPIFDHAADSQITVGDNCLLISRPRSTALGVSRPVILRTLAPGAELVVGVDTGMSGTTVCAALSVTIGSRVLLGADVLIADTDFHEVDEVPRRHLPIPTPLPFDRVVIGDDVFVGARTIVLRGATIGSGSVVGAGSVVTGEIPARVVAAGNPCRVIRPIEA